MSDFKERRDAGFLAVIGFSHAKNMAIRATRGVAHYNEPTFQEAVADDACLAVVPPSVLDLERYARENKGSIGEIQTPFDKRRFALLLIERDPHELLYIQ